MCTDNNIFTFENNILVNVGWESLVSRQTCTVTDGTLVFLSLKILSFYPPPTQQTDIKCVLQPQRQ